MSILNVKKGVPKKKGDNLINSLKINVGTLDFSAIFIFT